MARRGRRAQAAQFKALMAEIWRRYVKMPLMLVRWAVTVWVVIFCFGRVKDKFIFSLALLIHFVLRIIKFRTTLLDGIRFAMDGYDAFKLFLHGVLDDYDQPEYDFW